MKRQLESGDNMKCVGKDCNYMRGNHCGLPITFFTRESDDCVIDEGLEFALVILNDAKERYERMLLEKEKLLKIERGI